MKNYKVEFTRLAKAFIEARGETTAAVEQMVRGELSELVTPEDLDDPDSPHPMNILFHTVFLGANYADPLICTPKGSDIMRVDTATYVDQGEVKRKDGLFEGVQAMVPEPDTEDC